MCKHQWTYTRPPGSTNIDEQVCALCGWVRTRLRDWRPHDQIDEGHWTERPPRKETEIDDEP
jgi:hypothetical protein